MQERATLARGSVVIECSLGAGTTVFARLPLAFEPAARQPRNRLPPNQGPEAIGGEKAS